MQVLSRNQRRITMNKPSGIGLALALVCLLALGAAAQEKKGLKVYISVDMEGIGGVV